MRRLLWRPHHICDDATQEVFLVVHRRLGFASRATAVGGGLGAIGRAADFRAREPLMVSLEEAERAEGASSSQRRRRRRARRRAGLERAASTDEVQRALNNLHPNLVYLLLQHCRDGLRVVEIAKR